MNLRRGATYNQAPSSVLAESNGIKRHPEPKAKVFIKTQVDSSVASLLQNDVQGAWKFFGLCPQKDKTEREDSSGIRPQNDMTQCDEPIRSDLSDKNTQNPKCRDSEVNNNCRQGKRQRRVLSERSEFTRLNAESSKLLVNEACGWFPSLCHQSDRRPRRTKQKPEVDSSVASLLQNDVQGAWEFFGLCAQNDKATQGDSSGICPQNDMAQCDEPICSDLSDENTQNPKCRDSEVNNNCRRGRQQRRVLSERSEFTRQNAESSKLLANAACGRFCETFSEKSFPVRRTK